MKSKSDRSGSGSNFLIVMFQATKLGVALRTATYVSRVGFENALSHAQELLQKPTYDVYVIKIGPSNRSNANFKNSRLEIYLSNVIKEKQYLVADFSKQLAFCFVSKSRF